MDRDSSKNSVLSKEEGREPPEERDEGSEGGSAIASGVCECKYVRLLTVECQRLHWCSCEGSSDRFEW